MELRYCNTSRHGNILARCRAFVAITLMALAFVSSTMAAGGAFNPLRNPLLEAQPPTSQQAILTSVLRTNASLTSCKPTGQISDARCDYETVEMDINSNNFFPILETLRRETFFRLYKVDLYRDCPFWNDNSLCMSPDCTVSKVEEAEIPHEYRMASLSSITTTAEADANTKGRDSTSPHKAGNAHTSATDTPADTCQCAETDFCHWEDEDWSPESSWVDLLDNPERFTGYTGTSAHKVWRSIYEENCFGVAKTAGRAANGQGSDYSYSQANEMSAANAADALSSLLSGRTKAADLSSSDAEQCLEKRVFYKLISGLHASISIHICHDYLDQLTGKWAPNLSCFVERIAQHPERLQNLYFTHAVLVRSLAKLGERLGLKSHRKSTALASKALSELAPGLPPPSSPATINLASLLQQAVNTPPTFDEASMFDRANPESEYLRTEFRDRFRNVSRIMDCVGCDKCRLWGKLQTNGLGTALKILFEANTLNHRRLLQRSELVALVNTIHRVSESIRAVDAFRTLYQEEVARHKASGKLDSPRKEAKPLSQLAALTIDQPKVERAPREETPAEAPLTDLPFAHRLATSMKEGLNETLHVCEDRWGRCWSWLSTIVGSLSIHGKAAHEDL